MIVLLSVALLATAAVLVISLIKLDEANIRIQEQRDLIDEQRDLIDKKETFGAAVLELIDTARRFDGVLLGSLVPLQRYESAVRSAWHHRWDAHSLDRDIAGVREARDELETLLSAADVEGSTNSTGTMYEEVIDRLGGGFVSSTFGDADSICEEDVLACVFSDDPYTVHFDAADDSAPYKTDWLRTGVAYHEFAHVLQFTNPKPTETAVAAFGGDHETMADCFALTYLDGWKLDHRIWVSRSVYWQVSIGYGHVCDDGQRQAVRDWYEQLGFQMRPLSQ